MSSQYLNRRTSHRSPGTSQELGTVLRSISIDRLNIALHIPDNLDARLVVHHLTARLADQFVTDGKVTTLAELRTPPITMRRDETEFRLANRIADSISSNLALSLANQSTSGDRS